MADSIETVKEKLGVAPNPKGQQYPSDPSVSAIQSYVSPKSVNQYELMDDCYYGSGHVKDGEYLIPFNREYHYKERREIAAYKNFIRPMVNALTDPVFTEEAPRLILDENDNEVQNSMANTFVEDVDNDGTGMQDFTEDATKTGIRHGVTFCLVDNFPEDEQPETAQQAIDQRIMPYCVKKNAWEVEFWKTDMFGKLTEIAFAEPPVLVKGQQEKRARKWTDTYSVLMAKRRSSSSAKMEWVDIESPKYHGLGVLPVVVMYVNKRRCKADILVDPPMYDMALLNLVIWNKDSEIRDLERSQAFSLLTIQTDNVSAVTVGPKNALIIPMEATIAPDYISPDSNILKTLTENNDGNREDLFRMAEQHGVYGVKSEASGVSLAWRFYGQEAQLKNTSRLATTFEQSIMDLFMLWTGERFTYVVQYPTDFQPGDRSAEIAVYKEALALPGVPEALRKKLIEKVTRLMLQDEDPDEVSEIVDSIYAEALVEPVEEEEAMDIIED